MKESLFKFILSILVISLLSITSCVEPQIYENSVPAAEPEQTYRVSYSDNGAVSGSVPEDTADYTAGTTVTVKGNTGDLIKTNHTFDHWNTDSFGAGTSYNADDTFNMPEKNVELFAIWQFSPNPLSFTETDANLTDIRYSPSCCTADVDLDGDTDLFISGHSAAQDVSILYLNNGTGIFSDADAGIYPLRYSASKFADVDRDGDLDLLLAGMTNSGGSRRYLYLNDGTGAFIETANSIEAHYAGSVEFGDVNNDSWLDLVITGRLDDASNTPSTKLYINNGDSDNDGNWDGFSDSGIAFTGVYFSSAAFGDVNSDGFFDLLVTGRADSPTVFTALYINDGSTDDVWNGSFSESTEVFAQLNNSKGIFTDIDNDNDLDIVLAGNGEPSVTHIYTNDGTGQFTVKQSLAAVSVAEITAGDPDNDGDDDLIISGNNSDIVGPFTTFYINDGTGNFSSEEMNLIDISEGSGCFFDADGDTDLDFIICGNGESSSPNTVLYLNGRLEAE